MPNKSRLTLILKKSVRALLSQQKNDGAVDGYCHSRILESLLTLHLLRNQSYLPSKQKNIENYLIGAIARNRLNNFSTEIEGIIATLAQRVIEGGSASTQPFEQLLNSLSGREQGRKTLYFGCLFAEMGMVSFSSLPFEVSAFQTSGIQVQTWASIMLCGLKFLYCYGMGIDSSISLEDQDFLVSQVLKTDIFENNVLTQIVGILALSKFLPQQQLEQPINALMQWQQENGGMPLMTGLDHFVTPLAGLAILETLPNLPAKNQVEAEASVMRMADYLVSAQKKDGGWSYMAGTVQTDVDDSALCGVLLARLKKQKFKTNLQKLNQYLAKMQNDDGGFPTYISGNSSTPSMTAAAIHGIAEILRCNPMKSFFGQKSIQQALQYLVTIQRDDGTFERRWSNADTHAMFRVAIALRSLQYIGVPPDLQKAMDTISQKMTSYLHTARNPDGGWGQTSNDASDILSTAYAVLCCTGSEKVLAAEGVVFLLSRQENDGTFKSRPDLIGPRPLPYDIPILSTIMSIYACGYFIEALAK